MVYFCVVDCEEALSHSSFRKGGRGDLKRVQVSPGHCQFNYLIGRLGSMKKPTPSYQRSWFSFEIISHAVSAQHRILVFARPASGQAGHDSVAPVGFRIVAVTQSPTVFIGFQRCLYVTFINCSGGWDLIPFPLYRKWQKCDK